ncbi:hypothetical protein BGW39_006763 [Mortierella sp. 14UC]|nr:hypothetical protein BGW39_006763 [Mortierella sp. 14UC]
MEVSTTTEADTIAAIPSTTATTATTAAAPIEEPIILPSPATPTPAAAEPEAEAEAEEEAREAENSKATTSGLSFIDLVYDTILLEESTLHRSRSAPIRGLNNTNEPILVPLFYTRLARAFEMAQTVCHVYHEVHPRHRVSRLAEQELEAADLTTVENVKAYVRRIGGCNGYFLDDGQQEEKEGESFVVDDVVDDDVLDQSEGDHPAGEESGQQEAQPQEQEQGHPYGQSTPRQQQEQQDQEDEEHSFVLAKAGIVFPPGKLSDSDSYSIPALTEIQIKDFNDRYGLVDPEYQDMVARVLFRLRKDYWSRAITTHDLDRMEPELLNPYGSRYAQRRREMRAVKEAERAMGSSDAALSQAAAHHLGELSHRLQGLQIVEAGKGDGGKKDRRPTFGLQGLFDLPLVLPTEGAYKSVSDGIMELYQKLVPSQNYMNRRTQLVQRLQGILNTGFPGQGLRLEVFGSYASGLGSESSDADLCITSEQFQKAAPYNDVRAVAQVLRRKGMTQVQPITNARVPIVKFVDPITKTNCDVNINHVLGIHNSELIRCYTMIDDRVRPFLYSVKALVKNHGINDSSQAWLSSYAYVMMAIGFLQAQDPPVLPTLQIQSESQMTELYIQMNHEGRGGRDIINCTFDRDPKRYANFGAANTKTVGQLLIEFFEFYSRFYDYQTMEVNVRCGEGIRVREDLTKAAARKNGNPNVKPPQRGRGEKKLVVMDPFIRDRNVAGSCVPRHLVRVWTIFESLYLTLSRGDFKGAFKTIPGYEDQEDEYVRGRRKRVSELTPAQERMIASKQVRAQVKVAAVQPRTPVQVQTQAQTQVKVQAQAAVKPQLQPTVIPAQTQGQVQGQGQAKAVNGLGATETHRSREKKTERKLERKESRREKRELNRLEKEKLSRHEKRELNKAASSSSNNIPNSATTTTASAATTNVVSSAPFTASPQQRAQEPIVVNAGMAVYKDVKTFGESGVTASTDGDDNDNDSQQDGGVGPDGESKSRKRRQRRSIARSIHAVTATTDTAVSATGPVTSSPASKGGTNAEGAVAAAVFASAVARATNSAHLKQPSTPATTLAPSQQAVGSDNNNRNNKNTLTRQQPAGDQFAQQLQQQHLRTQQQLLQQQQQKKFQKQQKQLNKQLSRQQAKQQQQQQGQSQKDQQQTQQGQGQQVQQLNPQFPVLAKTHKLLLGKSKEAGNSGGNGGNGANGGGVGRKNKDVAGANDAANSGSFNNGGATVTTAPMTAAAGTGAKSNGGSAAKRLSRVHSNKPQPPAGPKAVANAAAFEQ